MKPTKPRRPKKADVKAAADRAEKRAKGEPVDEPKVAIDPEIIMGPKLTEVDATPSVIRVSPGRGRPTAYKPEFCQSAAEAALNGATDEEIAEDLGVDVRTMYRWRAKHPDFRQCLQWGKDECDERVERAMYARAVGYTYDAVKIMQYEGSPVIVSHKEHVPPDVGAGKMWLTNRKRKDWADRQQIEHGNPGDFDDMSPAELDAYIEAEAPNVLRKSRGTGKGKASTH